MKASEAYSSHVAALPAGLTEKSYPRSTTSLYPATSVRSRRGMARAAHERRSAYQSRITAASIISLSASGSAILPKLDSTRHRRASQPSIWSLTPATPNAIAAGQLCPPFEASTNAANTGIRPSRRSVSAFGIWASGAGIARAAMLTGYGGGRSGHIAGVRERAQPRVSARLARADRGRGLLGLAGVHAGHGPGSDPGTGPFWLRPRVPGDARRRVHRRRRVPLPWAHRGARGRRGGCGGGDRARAAARRLRARRARALPPGVARGVPRAARVGAGDRGAHRSRPPLRPRLPPRLARGARSLRRRRGPAAPRPRWRAAARDRRVHGRAWAPAGRAAGGDRLPRAARDGRPRHPRRRARARPARRRGGPRVRLPD